MTKRSCSALFLGAALAAIVAFTGFSGCDDEDDDLAVTGASCSTICNRYRTCFNPSYDVNTCTNQCQTALSNKTIISTDADDCLECLGQNGCAPAYTCADACDLVIVVP